MNITEGPEAFQIFFEQFLYSVGNEYVDSAECTSYNNQTDVITEHIYQIDLALNTNNETLLREGLIKANSMLLQEVKDKSTCGIYTNKNVTQILENSIKVLNSTKLNISQDDGFSSEIYLGQAQYTLELHGFTSDVDHIKALNNARLMNGIEINPGNDMMPRAGAMQPGCCVT